ncbi:FkbM family methyltransferase [Phenylobacterium sp.]|uniref:FkbM family methyltransferase n=1 Tax=Phenylobacterium sp. TaxID=1871053 RepID=UPI002731B4F1|nr:FkbM family methyltransferase [Phenylobacterium sp.]MDP1600710.1 FkbM family methyltransferase [Phenylobacterium sp.]
MPAHDSGVGLSLRENGEFARIEVDLIKELSAGGVLIDVGANIGSIALPAASAARLVIALEANRGFANVLATNTLNNGLFNVSVVHAAVGETERLARFPMMPVGEVGNLGTSGFHMAGKYPEEVVRMTTIDRIAPNDTRVVKIDVEGYESSVLKGATRTLTETRPTWLVESGEESPATRGIIQTFLDSGYLVYWFFAPFVTPRPARGAPPAKLRGDVNILAVPSEGAQPNWEMKRAEAGGVRPTHVSDFPYLARFGFKLG